MQEKFEQTVTLSAQDVSVLLHALDVMNYQFSQTVFPDVTQFSPELKAEWEEKRRLTLDLWRRLETLQRQGPATLRRL